MKAIIKAFGLSLLTGVLLVTILMLLNELCDYLLARFDGKILDFVFLAVFGASMCMPFILLLVTDKNNKPTQSKL